MENYRNIFMFIVSLMVLNLFTVTTYANDTTDYEVDVVNTVSVGDIQIGIEQYSNVTQLVVPNQTISQTIRIRNLARPAWIRVKVEYQGLTGVSEIEDSSVGITSENWIKCGEYYYHTKSMDSASYIDLCNSITIPEKWDSSGSGKRFNVIITADAVQKRNFSPNFNSSDPWFGTVIETSIHNKYTDTMAASKQSFQVVFEDGTQGLVRTGENFLGNFNDMMPGDVVTDKVRVANNYSEPIELHFRAESLMNSSLLGAIEFSICIGDVVVYSGTLDSAAIKSGVSLGKYSKGSSADLIYTLVVPSDMGNNYAQSEASVKWIFYTALSKVTEPTKGSGGGGDKEESTISQREKEVPTSSVETTVVNTEPTGEDLIKMPDDFIARIREINDERLKPYLDKEYLTLKEFAELLFLLEGLGIPTSEYTYLLPKTGDTSDNTSAYLFVMIFSLVALSALAVMRRRLKEKG